MPIKLFTRRAILAAFLPTMLLLAATINAGAHAMLDRAEPRVGNTVATPPSEVTLWFTQKIEASFSSITVTNAAGKRVDTGQPRISGNHISVSLTSGGMGTYRVVWRVLSVDAHRTDGSFSFRVGQ